MYPRTYGTIVLLHRFMGFRPVTFASDYRAVNRRLGPFGGLLCRRATWNSPKVTVDRLARRSSSPHAKLIFASSKSRK